MPRVKPIVEAHSHLQNSVLCISPDGHTLVFLCSKSLEFCVYFINAVTFELVTSVNCKYYACNMKITNNHAFIPDYGKKEFTIISFKGTGYLSQHECKAKVIESERLQYIISDHALEDVLGIYAPSIDPEDKY
jgi:hypothetical protein